MDETRIGAACRRISPRLVIGLVVMALGALLTLDNLGLFDFHGLWRYWPVVLILIGVSKFIQGADAFGALVWAGVGAAILAANFDLLRLRQVWPLLFVVVGARLVFGAVARGSGPRPLSKHTLVDAAETVDVFAMLGGVQRGTNTGSFRSGAASAFMGGCEIDLRKARMAGSDAVFDCFAMWGGVEIRVPEDWAVENRGVAFMGGFVDSTKRPSEPRGRLVLTGLALMGGVEAKN
jgi:predicted membrane protein